MRIQRLHEFDLNESFLSSLFGGIGNLFKSKKSKLESLLKDIKKAREEDVKHTIGVEKELWNLPKENTPEYRFQVTNLNRQSRTYTSMKKQELDSLVKEGNKIIDGDTKLQAFFSAGLARIEQEVTETLIKGLKPYKEKTYLDQLNAEFDALVRDATKKTEFYTDFEQRTRDTKEISMDVDTEIINIIDSSNKEAIDYFRSLDDDSLYATYKEMKDLSFDLDIKYTQEIDQLRKDKKKALKDGQSHLVPYFEEEEVRLRYQLSKPIEKLRSKIFILEKEIKKRKYANL